MREELSKLAFQVSQYSGPLSYGAFPMVSSLPDPGQAGGMQANLTSRTAKRMRGEPVEKQADVSPASSWNGSINSGGRQPSSLPDPQQAGAMQSELFRRVARHIEKRSYSVQTPAGRLASTRSVGAPKVTAPPGPSIAEVAKPKGRGFGGPIPGAKKGML
jgi:hypothetical protein